MDGFEHGVIVADIHGRQESQSADEAARKVGNDIAVEVWHDDDIELFRTHDQLHAGIVDDFIIAFNLRIVSGDGAEGVEE